MARLLRKAGRLVRRAGRLVKSDCAACCGDCLIWIRFASCLPPNVNCSRELIKSVWICAAHTMDGTGERADAVTVIRWNGQCFYRAGPQLYSPGGVVPGTLPLGLPAIGATDKVYRASGCSDPACGDQRVILGNPCGDYTGPPVYTCADTAGACSGAKYGGTCFLFRSAPVSLAAAYAAHPDLVIIASDPGIHSCCECLDECGTFDAFVPLTPCQNGPTKRVKCCCSQTGQGPFGACMVGSVSTTVRIRSSTTDPPTSSNPVRLEIQTDGSSVTVVDATCTATTTGQTRILTTQSDNFSTLVVSDVVIPADGQLPACAPPSVERFGPYFASLVCPETRPPGAVVTYSEDVGCTYHRIRLSAVWTDANGVTHRDDYEGSTTQTVEPANPPCLGECDPTAPGAGVVRSSWPLQPDTGFVPGSPGGLI